MKVVLLAALVLVVAVAAEEKLLGADDVDKKHAEMDAGQGVVVPAASIKDMKKQAKEGKDELRALKMRARVLKEQLQNADAMSKDEKKNLRKEFSDIKKDMKSKKGELKDLKKELSDLKSQKKADRSQSKDDEQEGGRRGRGRNDKQKGGRRGKNKDLMLIGAEEKKINAQDTPQPDSDILLTKEQRKAQRKEQKKADRKAARKERKNKKGNDEDDMGIKLRTGETDSLLPRRGKKGGRGRVHQGRISCETSADCHNGAMCLANRRGDKFCRGNGMDKPAGKKCRRSEQCARGLQCFVANSSASRRKVKGICADPATADLNTGRFLPFETPSS